MKTENKIIIAMKLKHILHILLLCLSVTQVSAQISGMRTLTAIQLTEQNRNIALKTASFHVDKWIKLGNTAAQTNLTEAESFTLEKVDATHFRLKSTQEGLYLQRPTAEYDLTKLGSVEHAALFTAGIVEEGFQPNDITVPSDVDKATKAYRLTAETENGTRMHLNTQNGNKLIWHTAPGPNSFVLVYDVSGYKNRTIYCQDSNGQDIKSPINNVFSGEGFSGPQIDGYQIQSVKIEEDRIICVYAGEKKQSYLLSFRPVSQLSELKDGQTYVIRNCYVHGIIGDRSGYIKFGSPIKVIQGQHSIGKESLFTLHKKGENEFSFAQEGKYIPNNSGISANMNPTSTECFFRLIETEDIDNGFLIQSVANNNYLNAAGGNSVLYTKNPHPYQIYEVTPCEAGPSIKVHIKYQDKDSEKLLKTQELSIPQNTYPILQELQAYKPKGFEIQTLDGKEVEKLEHPEVVSAIKTEYTVEVQMVLNMSTSGWTSLYCNYPLSIPEHLKIYTAKINEEKQCLSLYPIKDIIPGNTAVLIESQEILKEDKKYILPVSKQEVGNIPDNDLKGNVQETEVIANNLSFYTLQLQRGILGFYSFTGPETDKNYIPPFTAYLQLTAQQAAQVKGLSFETCGTTNISNTMDTSQKSDVIYDLSGKRLEQISIPGIYIQNGKKKFFKP